MSLKNRPAGNSGETVGSSRASSLLSRLARAWRTHLRTWPRRYVEMRTAAREEES